MKREYRFLFRLERKNFTFGFNRRILLNKRQFGSTTILRFYGLIDQAVKSQSLALISTDVGLSRISAPFFNWLKGFTQGFEKI